ncbi:MAG TPA: NmrA/HSCARG family protein [Bryobacteraceae bacterium]|nr:NmrA/HSCARG family protein [Bryobacteraceae bacterium]
MAKHHDQTILVIGATGHQGGAALRHLRQSGFALRAFTRDPEKPEAAHLTGPATEIFRGDLDDQESLRRALDGVHGVFSVQDSKQGYETEVRHGRAVADLTNRARVDHLVYSSVASADRNTGIPHFDSKFQIENHIRNTGLRYTIIRPVAFMENFLAMRPSIENGAFSMPLSPQTRLQMIAVDDIGAFAAMAFVRPGHWQNRVMELAGDDLSMEEIAETLSRVTEKKVSYVPVPWERFEQQAGKEMTTMFRWFEREGYHVDIPGVRLERPQLMRFERWASLNWQPVGTRASGGGAAS